MMTNRTKTITTEANIPAKSPEFFIKVTV